MTHLQVQTMGVPRVRYQGKGLNFRTRKAVALLIYLGLDLAVLDQDSPDVIDMAPVTVL